MKTPRRWRSTFLSISAVFAGPWVAVQFADAQALSPGSAFHEVRMDAVPISAGKIFKIEDREAIVNGMLVERMVIGLKRVVITYVNKSLIAQKPDFAAQLLNRYGMQIGQFETHWHEDHLAAGDTQKEKASFAATDLESVFRYSGVSLPADWDIPAYLILSGSGF